MSGTPDKLSTPQLTLRFRPRVRELFIELDNALILGFDAVFEHWAGSHMQTIW